MIQRGLRLLDRGLGRPLIIGMVHLQALPGTPLNKSSKVEILDQALKETETYIDAGLDGVMVENMHDIPYVMADRMGPETTAFMSTICSHVRELGREKTLFGVQVLAGANREAIAIAAANDLDFVRAEGFVFSHVADEGWMDGCAGDLLRYRKQIGAEDVAVICDIKKKHCSHAVTSDLSTVEVAKAAEFFLADGLVLTGGATGEPGNPKELHAISKEVNVPIFMGSGVTSDNIEDFWNAHGLIVGSHFKKDGNWVNQLDKFRITEFMKRVVAMKRS